MCVVFTWLMIDILTNFAPSGGREYLRLLGRLVFPSSHGEIKIRASLRGRHGDLGSRQMRALFGRAALLPSHTNAMDARFPVATAEQLRRVMCAP